ncbi:MAG: hypothetical protein ACLP8S_16405 [Solirubrobacteraceae bacterium]
MTGQKTLIDQALAASAAAAPIKFGDQVKITPEQALVYTIYCAVEGKLRGYDSDAEIKRYVRTAARAGIPEPEIQAAIAAAEAAFTPPSPGTAENT